MKRIIALLVCFGMLVCMAACGGTEASSAAQEAEVSEPAVASAPEPEIPVEPVSEEEPSIVEESIIPEIPEESDDLVISGENEMTAGTEQILSVNSEGLTPLHTGLADTTLVTMGNLGHNIYASAGYITQDGVGDVSNPDMVESGSILDTAAEDVVIDNSESGTNGILVNNAAYEVRNASITMNSLDNGMNTCDFVGKGAALMASGSAANVTVSDSEIDVTGVGRVAAFVDNGATMTIRNSTLYSRGGTVYESYHNTADMGKMIAPPWVLGIMGNSRCTNLMGLNSTMNIVDTDANAGAWAGFSTDAGTNVHLNVYNSSITLLNADESEIPFQMPGGQVETADNPFTTRYGSGYGAYTIGSAVETFAGATINVGTMANIFTGGTATYTNLEKGKTYTLESGSGEADVEYTAQEDKNTVIESDTQGFMIHQNANWLNVLNGTEVNSRFASVLMKTGSSSASMDAVFEDSTLNTGNGILVQLIDNDDALLGGMDSNNHFYEEYHETAGFLTSPEAADGTVASEVGGDMGPGSVASTGTETANYTFRNMTLDGNMYNAGGWYGGLVGIPLNINLEDTTLNGAIATTSAIHVTYDGAVAYAERNGVAFDDEEEAAEFAKQYQATDFTVSEYWIVGEVANMICYNGSNVINVALDGDAVWNVESTSMINSLTISGNAKVVVPEGITLNIDGTEYTDCTISDEGVYGTVVEASEADASTSGGFGGPPAGGPPAGGPPPGGAAEAVAEGPVYKYIWSLDPTSEAVIRDMEDGTVVLKATGTGTVKVRVDVVIDGVSAGSFVKIVNIS